mmetsp:Transcript_18413/g.42513  ORF Transcript_18413/g.42513 Transcript_18413/m.42513 type:complete len:107 (+) Transcript_18413:63-383(+)
MCGGQTEPAFSKPEIDGGIFKKRRASDRPTAERESFRPPPVRKRRKARRSSSGSRPRCVALRCAERTGDRRSIGRSQDGILLLLRGRRIPDWSSSSPLGGSRSLSS